MSDSTNEHQTNGFISHPILTAEKISEIIIKFEKTKDVELLEHSIGSGSGKGEGWNSSLMAIEIKARVNGMEKEYNWVGKFLPEDPEKNIFVREMKMGEKEALVYAQLFPALKKFIEEKGLENEIILAVPECLFVDLKEHYFILQNLRKCGFADEIDKQKGFDVPHMKLALDELAKLHATSHAYIMALAEHKPIEQVLKENELLTRDYCFTEPTDVGHQTSLGVMKSIQKNIFAALKSIEQPGEDFVQPLEKYLEKENTLQHLCGRKVDLNAFNTLIHNDYWFNNVMFKYQHKNGMVKPNEIAILDFAIGCWASPAIDLSYLFVLSMTPELRKETEEDLIKYYHSQLVTYLEKFGISSDVYTYKQLVDDYHQRLVAGLFFFLNFPHVWLPKDQGMDQSDTEGEWSNPENALKIMGEMFIEKLQKDENLKNRIRGNYLDAINKGIF